MSEQRVIASKPKIPAPPRRGAIPTPAAPPAPTAPDSGGRRRGRTLLVVLVAVLLGAGAAWFFLMGPGASSSEAAAEPPPPEPGAVQVVEAISLNLAGGHYLRIGVGLQLTADVSEEVDAAQALDTVIELFSGRTVDEVASVEGRATLKAELAARLGEVYEGEVMDVYFTDYVTQ